MRIKANSRAGFTLVEIMIVVAIIGLLMAVALPNFSRALETTKKNNCIANLMQIKNAKLLWATDNKVKDGATTSGHEAEIDAYLNDKKAPVCQGGGTYTYGAVGEDPTCSLGESKGHKLP